MAKKSRRVKKKGQAIRLSPAQMVQPGTGEVAEVAAPAHIQKIRAPPGPLLSRQRE